jgi:hypothetical protein
LVCLKQCDKPSWRAFEMLRVIRTVLSGNEKESLQDVDTHRTAWHRSKTSYGNWCFVFIYTVSKSLSATTKHNRRLAIHVKHASFIYWLPCERDIGYPVNVILATLWTWYWLPCERDISYPVNVILATLLTWYWLPCERYIGYPVNVILATLLTWYWLPCERDIGYPVNVTLATLLTLHWLPCERDIGYPVNVPGVYTAPPPQSKTFQTNVEDSSDRWQSPDVIQVIALMTVIKINPHKTVLHVHISNGRFRYRRYTSGQRSNSNTRLSER